MLFLPSTTIPNIKLNVQIILSLAIFAIGVLLTVAQVFTHNEVIVLVNLYVGFFCLFIGLLSMYSASKGHKEMMPVLLIGIYLLLTFLFFNHSDATKSSPVVLCAYIALIAIVSFKYTWPVSLFVAILCSATEIIRLYLINNGFIEVAIGDNPMWLNNVIILIIITFSCIVAGYYGHEMNKFATKLATENKSNLGKVVSEHDKNQLVLNAIKKIDAIYLSHASKIDTIIIANEKKLNPENDISYEELLNIGNSVSGAIDELLRDINNNIERV